MRYPRLNEVSKSREYVTRFGGYNHTLACQEGEFFDMKNMTASHYPVLSPRDRRGIVRQLTDPQGVLDKEKLMWIDGASLFVDGEEVTLSVPISTDPSMQPKTMTKMGAYVVIMPDKIWYNADDGSSGAMEETTSLPSGTSVSFTITDGNGQAVTWHDPAYWETHTPTEGDYMLQTVNGVTTLSIWSDVTSSWNTVVNTFVMISATGIGAAFSESDGVEITIDNSAAEWEWASELFVNDLGDGKRSISTSVYARTDDSVTIVGILHENKTFTNMPISVSRSVPDMAFITECNNRLWGCSKDGHEIYCCKLGDVKNWNAFQGISTDSWAATIGSDGVFTGAITYNSFPIFFKEDSLIKISISSTGAHQLKETRCRGVQAGSERSLVVVNEMLFFKSTTAVCAYNGSVPFSISDNFGEEDRYSAAVAGAVGDKYYISMHNDTRDRQEMFVYHSGKGLWHKEDDTSPLYFCTHGDDLYFIDSADHALKSVRGTLPYDVPEKAMEGKVEWMAQSGHIGYSSPDNKYVSRICVRMSLEFGSQADFWIRYDSEEEWEHKFNMAGSGTRSFMIPVIPRRCDHFEYKLTGTGACKIYGITKTIEEGSDI